jgi:outer membrane protein
MKRLIISAVIIFSASAVRSQTLTLQEAINIALQKRLEIQIARNNVEISTVNNHIGVAGGLPTVNGNLGTTEQITSVNQKLNNGTTIQRDWAASNNMQANVTASQVLYNGMRVVSAKKRLDETQKQSEQLLNAQVQNIMADVMLQYFDIVRQQNYTNTILLAIDAAKQRLNIVEVRQSVGLANNADLFQAQIDVNTLNQSLEQQRLVIDQAKTDLLRSLNLRPDSLINISDTIIVEKDLTLLPVLENIKNNPQILALDQQIRINEYLIRETAAQRYPTVRVNSGINFGRNQAAAGQVLLNQSLGPNLGIAVAIPIYNGGVIKRQIKVAEINTENAKLNRNNAIADLNANAVRNFQAYSRTLAQIDSAQKNFNITQQLLELTLLRFQLGQATIIEVREAQRSFEEAGYRRVNLAFAAKVSEIELRRLSNRLTF